MEGRRRVREHILRIDDTFKRNEFAYRAVGGGAKVTVVTPEELQYPTFAGPPSRPADGGDDKSAPTPRAALVSSDPFTEMVSDLTVLAESKIEAPPSPTAVASAMPAPQPAHIVVPENARGWSYRRLFEPYLRGATQITIRDPYVRHFHQVRNVMEFLQVAFELVQDGDEVAVHLVTQSDPETREKQLDLFDQLTPPEEFEGDA
jgi:ATP-dependent Lon protease